MTQRDQDIRLHHMRDHAREALGLMHSLDQPAFERNRVLQLAIVHLLEIVGEAAARAPDEVKSQHPEIPWQQISGLRNRLIHGYDAVDLGIVWSVVKSDLPNLLIQLDSILGETGRR
jgi:uncharacterized protein with HEPN domain